MESSRTSLASRTSSSTYFQVLGLGLEASSPWPWPRSLRSSKTALSSARGQHYFMNRWNFVWKRQKPREKFASTFFVFRNWSVGLAKRASPPPNRNFTNDKNVKKKPIVSSVSISFLRISLTPVANNNIEDQGPYAEISLVARSRSSLTTSRTTRTTSYSEIALEVVLQVSLLVRLPSLTS